MKIAIRLVLLAALAGLGFWLYTVLFPSPEKLVLKKIASLAATATITAGDGNITRATKVSNFIGYFSVDAEIVYNVIGYPAGRLSGRDEIRETARNAFVGVTAMKVEFLNPSVRLGADNQTADVSCTARVEVGDKSDFGVEEAHFQLRKEDGDWRITRAETVKTLH